MAKPTKAPDPAPRRRDIPNTRKFTISAQESRTIKVSSGTPVAVKLVADRPIIAEGTTTGFVPSVADVS